MTRRVGFIRTRSVDSYVEVVFGVRSDARLREASVRVCYVGARPCFVFPHVHTDAGLSLGSPDADAALVERARQIVALTVDPPEPLDPPAGRERTA
jgi:hypothetical protein